MIPTIIQREHVFLAAEWIDKNGVGGRASKRYVVIINRKPYPPKLVISRAYFFATGSEWSHENFTGGEETNSYLRRLGFEIRNTPSMFTEGLEARQRNPTLEATHSTSRSTLDRVRRIASSIDVHTTTMESDSGGQEPESCLLWHKNDDDGKIFIVCNNRPEGELLYMWAHLDFNPPVSGFVGDTPMNDYREFLEGFKRGRTEFKFELKEKKLESIDMVQVVPVCANNDAFGKMIIDAIVEIFETDACVRAGLGDAHMSSHQELGKKRSSGSRDTMYV